jgi:hypothetical protein
MSFDDLDPRLAADERAELEELASRLLADRPVPRAAFRGDLRRRIAKVPIHRRVRLQVAAYLATGASLLIVATLGVNGVGPLAPQPLTSSIAQAQVSAR